MADGTGNTQTANANALPTPARRPLHSTCHTARKGTTAYMALTTHQAPSRQPCRSSRHPPRIPMRRRAWR
eukprot:12933354-Prorocentrum_lima.AAC.1